MADETNFDDVPQMLSLTHHTFLVGPWKDAGEGAVLVTQPDDEDEVVLILKPDDVRPLIAALQSAAARVFPQPQEGAG